jgi:outer membrane immunogenic protein
MNRQFALSAMALLGFTGAAGAADLPAKKPPPPPPPAVFTWEGFYLGGQIGGGWARDKVSSTSPVILPVIGSGSVEASGIIGGAHAGYNWQFGHLVYGLEGDFEGANLRKDSDCVIQSMVAGVSVTPGACGQIPNLAAGDSFRTALLWQSSARARLGYALDNFLVYGTGGVAIAGLQTRHEEIVSLLPFFAARAEPTFNRTAVGFTLGGGVEYAIDANWSVRAEYRFSDFGKPKAIESNQLTNFAPASPAIKIYHSVNENAVLFGVSYRFDTSPSTIAAR